MKCLIYATIEPGNMLKEARAALCDYLYEMSMVSAEPEIRLVGAPGKESK